MNLFDAAGQGDESILTTAIADSPDIDARNEKGWTALMVAMVSKSASLSMVELLLKNGANPNALMVPPAPVSLPDDPEFALGMSEIAEELGVEIPLEIPQEAAKSVLSASIQEASLEKINLLVEAGADVNFVDCGGYSVLLTACYGSSLRNKKERRAIVELLLARQARETPPTEYGESVVSVLSNQGNFDLLQLVLEHSFNRELLGWTSLHSAIAFEDFSTVQGVLASTDHLEHHDAWQRTPFLLAVIAGRLDVVQLLANAGCDTEATGRCGATALEYSIRSDSVAVCRWLIEHGCDVTAVNQFGQDSLKLAVEHGSVRCAELLIAAGADPFQVCEYGFGLLHDVDSVEMFNFLAAQGLNTSEIHKELRLKLLGESKDVSVTKAQFHDNRQRRFGAANPQPMNNSFWDAQVRTRISAFEANQKYAASTSHYSSPTWCCDRFGQSFTPLVDGRVVEIGGEHEDSYDPDFCIYNDVIVHDGTGGFTIYGYPKTVFPPTDFHTATLVRNKIVIIGCLGYPEQRQADSTPVFVLNCSDWSIEELSTSRPAPCWLNHHTALLLNDDQILVRGGKSDCEKNSEAWILDLRDHSWLRK